MNLRALPVCSFVVLLSMTVAPGITSPAPEGQAAGNAQANNMESRQTQFLSLLDEEWQYELRSDPEMATTLGDTRYNDRLTDHSLQFHRSDVEAKRKFLARFEALDPAGFPQQSALSRDLMIRNLRQEIEGAQFKSWEMPVNQMAGPHLEFLDLVTLTRFNDLRDYENYLSRLHQVCKALDQTIANMRQGMQDHLMPPSYLLEKVTVQAQEIANQSGEASPFAKPLAKFPSGISADDQLRLRSAILAAINTEILPAYKRFSGFVRDDYAPHGRSDPGVWALPDGAARYRFEIRRLTTTDLAPEQIHQLGLKQVAETEAQMLALAYKLGFNDLASLNEHIKKDQSLYATSGEQVLDLYTKYTRQMEAQLPKLFERLPRNKLVVIPMDPFRARNAVPADYTAGAQDGSRPGRINVNQWDPEHRLALNIEAIAYHEGVPGHHLQISIGQELQGLPDFRKSASARRSVSTKTSTVTTDGWRTKCGAPSAWSSTPECMRNTGRVSRWWTFFTATRRWMSPMSKPKWTATSHGPDRL